MTNKDLTKPEKPLKALDYFELIEAINELAEKSVVKGRLSKKTLTGIQYANWWTKTHNND